MFGQATSWLRVLGVLAVAVLGEACGGSSASATNGVGGEVLFVRQVNAAVAGGSGACTFGGSPTSLSLLKGSLDVALRVQYDATLLVGFRPAGGAMDSSPGVSLQQVVARLEDPTGSVVWGPVTVPVTGFIDSPPVNGVSYGVTQTVLIGSEFTTQLAQQLQTERMVVRHFTASARVLGRTVGGSAIESVDWPFPIDVCYGCLITYPREASSPLLVTQPNCDLSPATGMSVFRPCRPGQDDLVDCRICQELLPGNSICEP